MKAKKKEEESEREESSEPSYQFPPSFPSFSLKREIPRTQLNIASTRHNLCTEIQERARKVPVGQFHQVKSLRNAALKVENKESGTIGIT